MPDFRQEGAQGVHSGAGCCQNLAVRRGVRWVPNGLWCRQQERRPVTKLANATSRPCFACHASPSERYTTGAAVSRAGSENSTRLFDVGSTAVDSARGLGA